MEWKPRVFGEMVPVIQRLLDELEREPMAVTPREVLEVLTGDAPTKPVAEAWNACSSMGRVPDGLPGGTRLALSLRLRAALCYCNDTAYHDPLGETAAEILTDLVTNHWDADGRIHWIQEDLLAGE
jgi:hypothetical protein